MLDILQYTSKAIFPRTTITLIVFSNSFISANKYCEQLEISDEFGLLLGGAHLTAAVINASLKINPSFLDMLVGLFANPVSYKALTSQSPELSPVNILPVLFPP